MQQMREKIMQELSEIISDKELIENIKWHFHIKSDTTGMEVFKEAQRQVLSEKLRDFFGKGVRTLGELTQKFISPVNPKGIPLEELEELVKDCLSVSSWEEAINSYGYPTSWLMETYIRQVCGIDTNKFVDDGDEEEITREMVETHFYELIKMIRRWSNPLGYVILGQIILETGAKLPDEIKKEIIEFTNKLDDHEDVNREKLLAFQEDIESYEN